MKQAIKHILLIPVLVFCTQVASGQQYITLNRCRQLAIESNPLLKMAQERIDAADALEKMALTQFFPKFDANATYLWNQKSASLLSDEQQDKINNIGTRVHNDIYSAIGNYVSEHSSFDPTTVTALLNSLHVTGVEDYLNGLGQDVTQAMEMDLSQVMAGAVSVVQPVYMGGKLRALYKTAQLNHEMQQFEGNKVYDDLMIAVDAAYWQYVSLQHKLQLAQQYCDLLTKLSTDVEAMVEAEVATQGDVTKVQVKLNEARMNVTKARGGVALARLALCQICGLDAQGDFVIVEDSVAIESLPDTQYNLDDICTRRNDMGILHTAEALADQGVRLARSGLLPNVALSGSYVVTNPNWFNGYKKEFGGMFTAGLAVNIPLGHAGDFYALKAAKHKRAEAAYAIEEARKLVLLEISNFATQLEVANTKLQESRSNMASAEENLRLADESFKAGVISTSDLMAAQTAWLKAQGEVLDAEIEVRMNNLCLQQALGKGNNGEL